jgi:hypothetical protein
MNSDNDKTPQDLKTVPPLGSPAGLPLPMMPAECADDAPC